MTPTHIGTTVVQCFECSNVIETRNGIMFNFYPGLPYIKILKPIAVRIFTTKYSIVMLIRTFQCITFAFKSIWIPQILFGDKLWHLLCLSDHNSITAILPFPFLLLMSFQISKQLPYSSVEMEGLIGGSLPSLDWTGWLDWWIDIIVLKTHLCFLMRTYP